MKGEHGNCFNCGDLCGPELYCFGCARYVCAECDFTMVMGGHEPEDHLGEDDELL